MQNRPSAFKYFETQYFYTFTGKIHAPTDFDCSNTFPMDVMTISSSTIDNSIASSSERVDIIPKNGSFYRITLFFDMISTLSLELAIGMSMVLSNIVIMMYYKVSEQSKSVEACMLPINLQKYCAK